MAEHQDPYVGKEILGQYQIEKKLGEGGMGMVYLADQPAMARKAAIKILRPDIASAEQMERFQREAQTLSNIDHPHIIKVYNFGTLPDGELYIAMEFVQGREMDKVLEDEGQMPWERAVSIIVQAADALVDAHSKGIVHRDLKPENIMLCERRDTNDYVKVMDFGIAKVLENSAELTSSATVAGIIHGTPMYMSPEQARGESVDARSDIYSLGIVLYAMLTCDLPIKSNTLVGYIIAHQSEPPDPLSKHNVQVPKQLETILMKMLEKKVEDRYQTMQEVLNELRALIAPPAAKANKRIVVLLVALVMALAGAGVAAYFTGLIGPSEVKVVKAGLPPGIVEASDSKPPEWIKRPPATTEEKTFVVGTGVAATKSEAKDGAIAMATGKVLAKASSLLLGDDPEVVLLKKWIKAAERTKDHPASGKLLADAAKKSDLGVKLKESDSDYWELRRPRQGASEYHYFSLFAVPMEELRQVPKKAVNSDTVYGMKAISLFPSIAPLAGEPTGIILSKVKDGGVADKAGVKTEDIVLRVNDQRVESPKDFVAKVKEGVKTGKKTRAPLKLELVRLEGEKIEKLTIEIEKLK